MVLLPRLPLTLNLLLGLLASFIFKLYVFFNLIILICFMLYGQLTLVRFQYFSKCYIVHSFAIFVAV